MIFHRIKIYDETAENYKSQATKLFNEFKAD